MKLVNEVTATNAFHMTFYYAQRKVIKSGGQ